MEPHGWVVGNPPWTLTESPPGKLPMTRWPPRGLSRRPGSAARAPWWGWLPWEASGGDGEVTQPMVGAHLQEICSRRTAHTAPYSFRSNLFTDPQAVPSHFILNLRYLLLKTWRCVPTETRHAGTSCPAPDICETAERKEERFHCALQFLQAAGARQNMPTCWLVMTDSPQIFLKYAVNLIRLA